MARNPAAAKTAARPARKRAPRATPATPSNKSAEPADSRSAGHAPPAAHGHGPEAFGAAIGGFLQSLSGLQLAPG